MPHETTPRSFDFLILILEVLGTANDLERLGLAVLAEVRATHVDLRDPHVVRIGVRLLGNDLGADHVLKGIADRLDRLDLGTGANVLAGKLVGRLRHIDKIAEPGI